ncbi:hypothetical protein ARMGADRAFT_1092137 [Armillaria gallica]|uniref:Uroporphyrinogen-III synthase n=1 Tax=Armillaria gallica TaxID=47427 RepID=A0A2H3CMY1_ARMGA|nr:hypothetical protein ARMGADRAFT_1092137 [Armillaria gallica]
MTSKSNVLLLREPTPSSDKTVLTNLTELASVTEQTDFDGVIMTSARSCEAWDKTNGTEKYDYVVGKATALTLRSSMPHADIRGVFENGRAARQFHSCRTTSSSYKTTGFSAFSQGVRDLRKLEFLEVSEGDRTHETECAMMDCVLCTIAAIGPTTATFLHETLGLRVDAIPVKPLPEEFLRAIVDADSVS